MHLLSPAAYAQTCTTTTPTISFGNVEFVDGTSYSTTSSMDITCTVPKGTGPTNFSVCLNIGLAGSGSWRSMTSGSNTLYYNLYQDAAHTTIWGSQYSMPPNPLILSVAVASPFNVIYQGGSTTVSATVYGYLPASVNTSVASGTYTQSLSGQNAQLNFTFLASGTPISCTSGGVISTQYAFTPTATVTNYCQVSASTLNFGSSVGVLSTAKTATSTITATCTSGGSYTIALNQGSTSGASLTDRQMISGSGAVVHYQLYTSSAYSTVWGDGTSSTSTQAGTGTGSSQSYTVYGRVPAQTSPAPNTYSDTITVTITY